jgi:hypothetical protein
MELHYRRPKTNLFWNFEEQPAERSVSLPAGRTRDWTALRKARPLDLLLPVTQRWAESLPDSTKPHRSMEKFPRIANRIASAWRDEQACLAVLDDLLVDRRGGRQGFCPFVQAELLQLRTLRCGGHSLYPGPFHAVAVLKD